MSTMEKLNDAITNYDIDTFDEFINDPELTEDEATVIFMSHQSTLRNYVWNRDFSVTDYYFMAQLLERGADINVVHPTGETSLTYALTLDIEEKSLTLVSLFLKYGLSWETYRTSISRLIPYDLEKSDDTIIPLIERYLRTIPLLHCPYLPFAVSHIVNKFL